LWAELIIEWLRSLPPEDQRAIGTDLATVQFGVADRHALERQVKYRLAQ
jgi:hypothetical protein